MAKGPKHHRCLLHGDHDECKTACGLRFKNGKGRVNHLVVPYLKIRCEKCWGNYDDMAQLRSDLINFINVSDLATLNALNIITCMMDRKELIKFAKEMQ